MAPAKKTSGRKKTSAGRARPDRKESAGRKKTTAKKTAPKKTAKRATAKKTSKKTTAARRRATAKKTTKKSSAKKTTKKTPKRTATKKTAKKSPRKAATKKATAKKTPRASSKKPTRKSSRSTGAGKTSARGPVAKKPTSRTSPRSPAMGSKTTRPRARAVKFDKKQLAQIREQLESERGRLVAQLEELTADSFDTTQSDMTGEVGLDDDFADAGSATFERERDLSIQNNVRDLIDQMRRAIQRIDDGNYGTCERCGNPIEAARLKALPHALLCMDCKRREERAR